MCKLLSLLYLPGARHQARLTVRFNCQMGRGRTTTGMIVASLIATIQLDDLGPDSAEESLNGSLMDGDYSTDASQYLNGKIA